MCFVCGVIGLFKSIFNIDIIDEKTQSHRMSVCCSCTHMNCKSLRCKVCGCFLKHKVRLINSKCPEGKW